MRVISPYQLHELQSDGLPVALLDVRTPGEHARMHVAGAELLPLYRLDGAKVSEFDGFAKDKPVYILCAAGPRARRAAAQLERAGFSQCVVVEGGITAWNAAGLPVELGAVQGLGPVGRIALGIIMLAGVILGAWVHPLFYGVTMLAVLFFAGMKG